MRAFEILDDSQREIEQLVKEKIRREEAFFRAEEPTRELLREVAELDRRMKPALQQARAVVITDLVDTRLEFLPEQDNKLNAPHPVQAANVDYASSPVRWRKQSVDLARIEWLLIELFFALKSEDDGVIDYLLQGLGTQIPGLWSIRYLFVEDDTKLVMLHGHEQAPIRQVLRNLRFGDPATH